MAERPEDRIFVRPRKHFRARYSTREPGLGALVLLALAAVAAWVAWRGGRPDPELAAAPPGLERRGPPQAVAADRGPLPAGLAPPGWAEGKAASFGPQDLYVKIDGREGYYKSFGFQRLWCLALAGPGGEPAIDLELYDLGEPANALGAAAGELPPGAAPELRDGTLSLLDKNALFLARGRHYLRAIGSADSEPVRQALALVRARVAAALPAGALPWSYALFLPLGVPPAKVSYLAENAFSFSFADQVHVGLLADGETELFATARPDAAAARRFATQLAKGFAEYGAPLGRTGGVPWFKDKYLSRASAALAVGRLVVGVHGAADEPSGAALLGKLQAAARALPADADLGAAPAAAKGE